MCCDRRGRGNHAEHGAHPRTRSLSITPSYDHNQQNRQVAAMIFSVNYCFGSFQELVLWNYYVLVVFKN